MNQSTPPTVPEMQPTPGMVVAPAPVKDTVAAEPQPNNTKSAKIMIVDDEPLVIRVVRRFLTTEGYTNFLTTTDPRKAFDLIKSVRPDIV